MLYKINKKLILEDYFQDMIDGVSETDAKHGIEKVDSYVRNESYLDKTLPPEKGNNVIKTKYHLFDDPNHTSLRMIDKISDKYNINNNKAVDNAHTFMKSVGHIENDNKVHGGNNVKGSTIEGLYQTSDEQAQTAISRFHRDFTLDKSAPYLTKDGAISVKDMNAPQQTAMTIAGLSGHGNSSNNLKHFSRMLDGDEAAAKNMYYKDHHTKPDPATYSRAGKIFGKMKLDQ